MRTQLTVLTKCQKLDFFFFFVMQGKKLSQDQATIFITLDIFMMYRVLLVVVEGADVSYVIDIISLLAVT